MGISRTGKIENYIYKNSVSFHVYPLSWLLESAENGNLFLLHIATEAVVLFDPKSLLSSIRERFLFKESYEEEIEMGMRIVSAILHNGPNNFSEIRRRRYYWGLRTTLMAMAAQERISAFSSLALERFSEVPGIAEHIQRRTEVTFDECEKMGLRLIHRVGKVAVEIYNSDQVTNSRILKRFGGVGATTVGEIIYNI
jgi:hypothetical protein